MLKSNPIWEWYISGLGGADVFIHVITACGSYKVVSVAEDYEPFFKNLVSMTYYTNHFIRCLMDSNDLDLEEVIDTYKVSYYS
jgi:hypothetical protein